ncbi:MAG: BMP family ABC transporter substrate-binding protein [Actinomycetota bacterium]
MVASTMLFAACSKKKTTTTASSSSTTAASSAAATSSAASSSAPESSSSAAATESSSAPAASSSAPEKKTLKVGLAYDVGGVGDKSFNDSANAGLERVKAELSLDVKGLSAKIGEVAADKEARLKLLADGGYNPIVAVGFSYAAALEKVAAKYPDIKFGIIDDASSKLPNVAGHTFAADQGSYIVGAAAALKSKTGTIGYVGGVQVPLLESFRAGYNAGAKQARPDIKVVYKYLTQAPDFSGFNDPGKGKEAARGMYDAGADVVYQVAGGSGTGVFEAAKAANAMAIGVDSDQYESAAANIKDVIITSMVKHVDVAVFDFVKSVGDDKFTAGDHKYDLANGGIAYSTSGGKIDDIKDKLEAIKKDLVDGKITIPAKP